jgi:hypothetical protein
MLKHWLFGSMISYRTINEQQNKPNQFSNTLKYKQ